MDGHGQLAANVGTGDVVWRKDLYIFTDTASGLERSIKTWVTHSCSWIARNNKDCADDHHHSCVDDDDNDDDKIASPSAL